MLLDRKTVAELIATTKSETAKKVRIKEAWVRLNKSCHDTKHTVEDLLYMAKNSNETRYRNSFQDKLYEHENVTADDLVYLFKYGHNKELRDKAKGKCGYQLISR